MSKLWARAGTVARVLAAVSVASLGLVVASAPADAGGYVAVNGSGSSWASIAID